MSDTSSAITAPYAPSRPRMPAGVTRDSAQSPDRVMLAVVALAIAGVGNSFVVPSGAADSGAKNASSTPTFCCTSTR